MTTAPAQNSRVRQTLNRIAVVGVVLFGMLGFAAAPAMAATAGPAPQEIVIAQALGAPATLVKTSATNSLFSPPRLVWKWDQVDIYLNRAQTQKLNSGGVMALTGAVAIPYLWSIALGYGTDWAQGQWPSGWCVVLHDSWMHRSSTGIYAC